ncbi:ABC transporter substrate-binding protein [Craterilacuibacter sinensis]|uniref:SsuA/THI5-like domain-containing protein n=1 Tax=Craterilacuibacter sinensis TaxID=2686017 RepID=A0A845BX61_9NEIS|nr:ABC transporter substrate-binding protein [Craterilacuibacter sinensis]MXR37093.1 hypothetical protein [Craterilacuibacter sinensis]
MDHAAENPLSSPCRRSLFGIGCALGLGALLPACRTTHPATLKISSHIWPGYEMLFVARHEGLLPADQINLIEVPSASDSLQLLAAGITDAATLTLDEVLRARATGLDLVVVMVFNISAGADVLLAREDIPHLHELKGLRIGVESSATGAVMLAGILQAAKLKTEDVDIIPLPVNDHENAWHKGQVDALISYPPVSTKLQRQGGHIVFDSSELPDTIFDVLAVRREALAQHENALRLLLRAHFAVLERLNQAQESVLAIMALRMHEQADAIAAIFSALVLPGPSDNLRLLNGEPSLLTLAAHRLSRLMQDAGLLPATAGLTERLSNPRFLPGVST